MSTTINSPWILIVCYLSSTNFILNDTTGNLKL